MSWKRTLAEDGVPMEDEQLAGTEMETRVPFSGFYNTIHSDHLDRQLDLDEDSELSSAEIEKKSDETDWKAMHIAYSKAYVDQINKMLGLKLEFIELDSPKFYNFETDRIFAKISAEEVEALKARVNVEAMEKLVADHFTSRSGFISHYASSYAEWLEAGELDHNQICTLIECILEQEEGEGWEDWTIENLYI